MFHQFAERCSGWAARAGMAVTLVLVGTWAASAAEQRISLVGAEVFIPCPRPGVRVNAFADYIRPSGLELVCYSNEQTRSDAADVAYRRFSADNGRTWTDPEVITTNSKNDRGTHRRYVASVFVDPVENALVTVFNDAVLPTDNPLEGMKHWRLWCAISRDGGRTASHEGPIMEAGDHTPEHPLHGVWVGKNGVMIGDHTCAAIRTRRGDILQPVQICPVGPDGQYYNPGGGYTYHDAAVLIGRWNEAGTIEWRLSSLVRGDPLRSTRGMLEPTIAEMPDGRVLMILRGSNDKKPDLPGYRWFAVSTDGGETWSAPKPWTYANGEPFFSPSSCSQLLRHSNGRIYWIGNISPANPRGNLPRYPLVIGEADTTSLLLMRNSVCVIDDRRADDPADLLISNFHAREDRETHEVVVYCSPLGRGSAAINSAGGPSASRPAGRDRDWTADAWLYRLRVPSSPAD